MKKNKKYITCDGNHAAAHIAYMFSEVAAIYPITPSSNMAENVDEWAAHGRKNIFGDTVHVVEMQSEAGAAGAVHGSLQAGLLTTTFTASQGLLLMIPNMYKISGELLPGVFHVSARSLAAQALSIFGDHSDVMSTRHTGFAMLATGSVQEIMDIAAIAHLTSIKSRIPFLHFFDGFRTSHEIQKIEYFENEDLEPLLDKKALKAFRDNSLNSEHPVTRGTAQNPDIYFQAREAANKFYDAVPDMVEDYMQQFSKMTGREYHPFVYYGDPNAENIAIAMGSITETIKETVDYLNANGHKVGLITVHLYRPFSEKYFLNVIPKSVKRIVVLDRTKEPGAGGEPLLLDVKNIFYNKPNAPMIIGGRYGLSSKDTTPSHIISVFENLESANPKDRFTLSINDDVTHLSLPLKEEVNILHESIYSAKFYGLGADGTVGANKNSIKIIGENTDKFCQAYFAYDSKKSGGFTTSHLRFGDVPIKAPYLVNTPDFVACHTPSYIYKYDMLKGLKPNGVFLLNTIWDTETTKQKLPNRIKKYLAKNQIRFYVINATELAKEIGLGGRINTIMQSAFFKITEIIPYELAVKEMKKAIEYSFSRKGESIVAMNNAAVDKGAEIIQIEIPSEWANLSDKDSVAVENTPKFISQVVNVINNQDGDSLPVSTFKGIEDGTLPHGTSKYEKRGIAVTVPSWIAENCIQCNQCSYVCPHAAIRPFLLTDQELENAPAGTTTVKGIGGYKDYNFRIQVSVLDCTGCGNCVDVCPSQKIPLVMKPLETQMAENERFKYLDEVVGYKENVLDKNKSVKNSQFAQPLFEFSGACAGCGETPYIKIITQLFGERMIIANATGCSSIYGGSSPSTPYTANYKTGRGVAWANSLFEDNAEFGFGVGIGIRKIRERLRSQMLEAINNNAVSQELKQGFENWINTMNDSNLSTNASNELTILLKKENSSLAKEMLELEQYFIKKSVWVVGGDGWAYDIGFGGLDHVISTGEDINMLVLDTEVYSNTGGQASKSTPIGAIAKFTSAGKRMHKKDLGMMAATYGYVYVAQVSLGASHSQFFNAIKEAEAYKGPSLIIAYSPCINHGLHEGMGRTQYQSKFAVESGYWSLFRYNPDLDTAGKNPFLLDSKEPDWSKFKDFINSEVRYTSLKSSFPEDAEQLFNAAEEDAKWRYMQYKRMSEMKY